MIIKSSELASIRETYKGKRIVFCTGSFDLVHAGHILFFEDCKKHGDLSVVMIGGDNLLKRYKGDTRPILNEHIRLKTIDSLKPVDFCFIEPELDTSNLLAGIEFGLSHLHPDVYIINTDASNQEYRKELCKKHGVTLKILDRTCPPEFESISTTRLIEKIQSLKD